MEIPQVGEGGRSKVTSASPTDDGECANMSFGQYVIYYFLALVTLELFISQLIILISLLASWVVCTLWVDTILIASRVTKYHSDLELVKSFTQVRFQKINSTQEKRAYCDIFGQQLRMEDVLLIYYQFSCNYLHTNSLQLFCGNFSLNLTNFTERVIFCVSSWKLYPSTKYLTQVSLVTNSMSDTTCRCSSVIAL